MSALYEAGAHALMLHVSGMATVTDRELEEARHSLEAANLADLARQLDKARELHRLFASRVVAVLRGLQGRGVE
jgi:hypothetical protein